MKRSKGYRLLVFALAAAFVFANFAFAYAANNGNGNNGNNSNGGGNGNSSSAVVASASQTVFLKGSGSDFDKSGWNNVFNVTSNVGSDPSVWHLVYSGKTIQAVTGMQITFTNGEVFKWTPAMGFSTNGGGNNYGWVIVAPGGWEIAYIDKGNNNDSGSFVVTNEAGNVQFNISGYHKGTAGPPVPQVGSLSVNVNVAAQYKKTTWMETRRWEIQGYYYNQLKKDIISVDTNTLVSWMNGGKDGGLVLDTTNGFTYVTLDIAALQAAGAAGIDFGIADSSPSNIPVGYSYNVRLDGNNVILSLKNIISASVRAIVYDQVPTWTSDTNGTHVSVDSAHPEITAIGTAPSSGIAYLFVHFAGGIKYSTDYKIVGTVNLPSTKTDVLLSTDLVGEEFVDVDYSAAVFDYTVTNSKGDVVGSGQIANGGNVQLDNLPPGAYKVVITNDDITLSRDVNVVANGVAQVNFGELTADMVNFPDQLVTLTQYNADYELAPIHRADLDQYLN